MWTENRVTHGVIPWCKTVVCFVTSAIATDAGIISVSTVIELGTLTTLSYRTIFVMKLRGCWSNGGGGRACCVMW